MEWLAYRAKGGYLRIDMIKLLGAIQKKAGWSDEDWFAHYIERHGPLTAGVRCFYAHTRKYIQNYASLGDKMAGVANHADWLIGVSELWFDDAREINAAFEHPDYMGILHPDELRFVNPAGLVCAVGVEHEIVSKPEEATDDKRWARGSRWHTFVFRKAATGQSDKELQAVWQDAAASIKREPAFERYVRGYVQTHAIQIDSPLPIKCPYGVVDEFWSDSEHDAIAYWRETRSSAATQDVERRLTHSADTLVMITRSHIVFGE
jgi:hypothetical protein